jgi:hypothetical protein
MRLHLLLPSRLPLSLPLRRLAFCLAVAAGIWLAPAPAARAQYGYAMGYGPPGYSYSPGFGPGVPYGVSTGYGYGYAAPYGVSTGYGYAAPYNPSFAGYGYRPLYGTGYPYGYGAGLAGANYYSSAYSVYAPPGASFVSGRFAAYPYGGITPYGSALTIPSYSYGYGRPVSGTFGYAPTARIYMGLP